MTRYHGVFASHSRWRCRLPPPVPLDDRAQAQMPLPLPAAGADSPTADGLTADGLTGDDVHQASTHTPRNGVSQAHAGIRDRRLPWAKLLKRTLGIDALQCPRCLTPMVLLAFITKPDVVRRILDHLHLPSALPTGRPRPAASRRLRPRRLPRLHPDQPPDDIDHHQDGLSGCCTSSRAPPTWRRTGT